MPHGEFWLVQKLEEKVEKKSGVKAKGGLQWESERTENYRGLHANEKYLSGWWIFIDNNHYGENFL